MNEWTRFCLEQAAWYAERANYLWRLGCDDETAAYYDRQVSFLKTIAYQ